VRLDHLLSKEYMLIVRTWYERINVHSLSTTDDADRSGVLRPNRLSRAEKLGRTCFRMSVARLPVTWEFSMTLHFGEEDRTALFSFEGTASWL
jgi:hypothetical protein